MSDKKVLIIEDEEELVKALEVRLKAHGYNTIAAYDGEEGLEKARSENPDLIILDIMLPKMEGFKLSRLLKFDWQNDFYLCDSHTVTFGLETEEERGKSFLDSTSMFGPFVDIIPWQSARTNSAYLQDQINVNDRLFTTLGVRVDDHEEFGSKVTYRVAPSYLIQRTGTRLKATYGYADVA